MQNFKKSSMMHILNYFNHHDNSKIDLDLNSPDPPPHPHPRGKIVPWISKSKNSRQVTVYNLR